MVTSVGSTWLWVGFNLFVLAMLALDLFVFNKEAHEVRLREAGIWSAVWISMALIFNAGLYHYFGTEVALDFLAGYLIEKSLSVDNLFVFLLVLGHFKVPSSDQHRVLFYGVVGALVMRVAFILAGTALITRFHWMMYIFGGFLVLTAGKMLFSKGGDEDVEDSRVLALVRRLIPMTSEYRGHAFFVREGGRLMATPLFAVLVVIEMSDVVFAIDSIPAIFGVTTDPFIVYTSNIFAILGLRALYFLLVGVLSMFIYLKYGLAVILAFIGVKMLIVDLFHVPIHWSLLTIVSILAITITASLIATRKTRAAFRRKEPSP